MFGDNKKNSDEIGKLWERLVPLERDILEKNKIIMSQAEQIEELQLKVKQPSESKAEAQSALRSIGQHKSRIIKVKDEVLDAQATITSSQADIEIINEKLKTFLSRASDTCEYLTEIESTIAEKVHSVDSFKLKIEEDAGALVSLIKTNPDLESKILKAREQIEEINESESKSDALLKTIASNHIRVRDLINEIFGYDVEDENGTMQKIDGLKIHLDTSYNLLEENLVNYKKEH
jgi:chromosome segregation ATPase